MVILEDVTKCLTSENLTETAKDLSKVLLDIQSTWLSRKLKASVKVKSQIFSNESTVLPVSITVQYTVHKTFHVSSRGFFMTNFLVLQLRNKTTFSRKTVCLGLCIDKTYVLDVFAKRPLNTNTQIIRTLWQVPLVSVLAGFHCIHSCTYFFIFPLLFSNVFQSLLCFVLFYAE